MVSRVRRVLRLVDELELDPKELGELRDEIEQRRECVLNLEGVTDEAERALLVAVKDRVDAFFRGETKPLTLAEGTKVYRQMRRERGVHRAPARRSAP